MSRFAIRVRRTSRPCGRTWGGLSRVALGWLLASLALVLGATARAAEPAWDGDTPPAQWLADPTGAASFLQMQSRFAAGEGLPATLVPGRAAPPEASRWLAIELPAVTEPRAAVLSLPQPGLDSVTFYWQGEAGEWLMIRSGERLPVASWPLPYLHPAFEWTVRPGQLRVYLHVDADAAASLAWRLWSHDRFLAHGLRLHLALGAGLGALGLVALLSLGLGCARRDPVALVHAASLLLIGAALAVTAGLGGEMGWPTDPALNALAPAVLVPLSFGAVALFLAAMVQVRGERWSWPLWAAALLALPLAGAQAWSGRGDGPAWSPLYGLLVLAASLAPVGRLLHWQAAVGGWLLAGLAMLAAGVALPLLGPAGLLLLPADLPWPPALAGLVLALPLWWVALLVRCRQRQDRAVAQQVLNRNDALTGLLNERVVIERLEHLIARQQRSPKLGAVLRVRIGNLAAIQQQGGAQAAEAAVLQAGRCVAQLARRSGDSVGRLSDGDFLLILEGTLKLQAVQDKAQTVIARGLASSDQLPQGAVLKLHVAATAGRYPGCEAPGLLARLGGLLAQMGQGSGRALQLLLPSAVPPAPPGAHNGGGFPVREP